MDMSETLFHVDLATVDSSSASKEREEAPAPSYQAKTEASSMSPELMDESSRHSYPANNSMASSVPMNIPERTDSSKWAAYDAAEGPTAFLPPHKLSCRDADHLACSVPLSSSTLIRTRTKILMNSGMIPSNSTVGFLVSRTGNNAEVKEPVDRTRSAEEEKSPRSE